VTKTLVIEKCWQCPFRFETAHCTHDDAPPDRAARSLWSYEYPEDGGPERIPEWCPLRAEPVHIYLKPQVPE
jgi:hypothetical protein